MRKIFRQLTAAIDHLTGRYQSEVATSPEEIATAFELRRKVFGGELGRVTPSGQHSPAEPDAFDDGALHIVCRDRSSPEIIGCVRMVLADRFKGHPDLIEEYALHQFPEALWPRITVVTRLVVEKTHRGSGIAALSLATKCYEEGMTTLGVAVATIVCEPHLFPMYRRLGYRPLDRVKASPFGGYRLPLFMIPHEYAFLRACQSPFMTVAKRIGLPQDRAGVDWLHEFTQDNGYVAAGFNSIDDEEADDFHAPVTRGLSQAGKRQLLHNAIAVQCRFGDKVLLEKSIGRTMGFVVKGALEVSRKNRLRIVLGEGDVFGEIGFLLDIPRTADVTAVDDDTEIVLLSISAIERVTDEKDRLQFWQNMARYLAQRIVSTPNG